MAKGTQADVVNTATGEVVDTVLRREVIDAPVTFLEAISEAEAFGLSEADYTVVTNVYEPLKKDKDALIGVPFFIRNVRFSQDKTTKKEFVILHVVDERNNRYLVTDGSTGLFTQISRIVEQRIDAGSPTPYNFILCANGLRKSEFGIDKDGNTVAIGDPALESKAATYYID